MEDQDRAVRSNQWPRYFGKGEELDGQHGRGCAWGFIEDCLSI